MKAIWHISLIGLAEYLFMFKTFLPVIKPPPTSYDANAYNNGFRTHTYLKNIFNEGKI